MTDLIERLKQARNSLVFLNFNMAACSVDEAITALQQMDPAPRPAQAEKACEHAWAMREDKWECTFCGENREVDKPAQESETLVDAFKKRFARSERDIVEKWEESGLDYRVSRGEFIWLLRELDARKERP